MIRIIVADHVFKTDVAVVELPAVPRVGETLRVPVGRPEREVRCRVTDVDWRPMDAALGVCVRIEVTPSETASLGKEWWL